MICLTKEGLFKAEITLNEIVFSKIFSNRKEAEDYLIHLEEVLSRNVKKKGRGEQRKNFFEKRKNSLEKEVRFGGCTIIPGDIYDCCRYYNCNNYDKCLTHAATSGWERWKRKEL